MSFNVKNRKIHHWAGFFAALPLLVIIGTGILLQLKKDVAWVQPPTQKGASKEPAVSFDAILAAVRAVPETGVTSWDDIDRVDVRPKDGIAKVTCKNRWEVQVDFRTGEVVQVAYRRSDLIEAIHDGSFFHDAAKLYVFLPTAVVVLGLWVTGMYLWVLPNWVRWSRKPASPKSQVKNTASET